MRNANTVLSIIRDRGKRGLPLEDVNRPLYNPELYLLAYGKIARNQGAMTPGVTETADGMSLDKIQAIINAVRYERYRWKPAKRIYIEKNGSTKKKRSLGLPAWSDKVLQEVIRTILDAYYEPVSPTEVTASVPREDATRPCRRSTSPGEGRTGL
jgi:hypothetical protein